MDELLTEAIAAFESAAQRIADRLPEHLKQEKQPLDIPFPARVVRPLTVHYHRWPYLSESRKKKVACAVQLCDAMWWHQNIWKMTMTFEPMWEWCCTVPVIAVLEMLAYQFGRQFDMVEKGTGFRKVVNSLRTQGAISTKLRKQLRELNRFKNSVYFRQYATSSKVTVGKAEIYGEAVRALRNLEYCLRVYWEKSD